MDERQYLLKAQAVDVLANATDDRRERYRWEAMAKEYRRLAHAIAAERQSEVFSDPSVLAL
jgi:hypothetical protein